MGADNWAVCPKCQKDEKDEISSLIKKKNDSYGKVSLEEFKELEKDIDRAKSRIASKGQFGRPESLREDYEIYSNDTTGMLEIDYSARCENCSFEFFFNKRIDMMEAQ